MQTLTFDCGQMQRATFDERRKAIAEEIERRKDAGAPLVDDRTGAELQAPKAPSAFALDGFMVTVRMLPRQDIIQLEGSVEAIDDVRKAATGKDDPCEEDFRMCGRLAAMTEKLYREFLTSAIVELSMNGKVFTIDDIGRDFWPVALLVKQLQHLTDEQKKTLGRPLPST